MPEREHAGDAAGKLRRRLNVCVVGISIGGALQPHPELLPPLHGLELEDVAPVLLCDQAHLILRETRRQGGGRDVGGGGR